ncbi:coiled-coil domain-containing protein 63 [Pogoniulus pusillus]|uniref:coiled-coil domain-containing protein 63 n=1 Tax=Pogoniulus pusillus TaxID=488313 RepID=UPI0030B92C18
MNVLDLHENIGLILQLTSEVLFDIYGTLPAFSVRGVNVPWPYPGAILLSDGHNEDLAYYSQGGPSLGQKAEEIPVKENENLVADEMRRLQKQLWIAAEKRKGYGANVRRHLQAQQKEIKSLTQGHLEVALMMRQITPSRSPVLADRNRVEINRLLQLKSQNEAVIRERKAQLAELDKQIHELEKEIVKQKQKGAKAKQAKDNKLLQKKLETLEKRLYNATVRFDSSLARNNKLREEIENMRVQKAILDNAYWKLHRKLEQQRQRMTTAMEQCTEAKEQRMEAAATIDEIKKRNIQETVQYREELEKLKYIPIKETKLKNFMVSKLTDRSGLEEKAEKEKALKAAERAKKRQWESMESRQVAYKRLTEMSEEKDIGQLMNIFMEREDQNFSSFGYSNKLKDDVEKLKQQISDLQTKISALTTDQERAERSSIQVLKELEEKLMETTKEANLCEESLKETSKILGQKKSDMEALLKEISRDNEITEELKGMGQITHRSLVQFFGLLEKMTNELLLKESILRYISMEVSDQPQPFTSPLLGDTDPLIQEMDPAQLFPRPPSLKSSVDVIDALEEPLDHQQLRQLVLQSQRKE